MGDCVKSDSWHNRQAYSGEIPLAPIPWNGRHVKLGGQGLPDLSGLLDYVWSYRACGGLETPVLGQVVARERDRFTS